MLKIKTSHKLTFTAEDKAHFNAILEKSQEVDKWAGASQYIMANAILVAFQSVQSNLNKAAVEIAQGQLNKKTKNGQPVKLSDKKRKAAEAVIKSKGADTTRAVFDNKNIETAIYEASDWDANKPKSADGQFNKLVRRASITAIVIWENPKEYAMETSEMVDDKGNPILDSAGNPRQTFRPMEAEYLAFGNSKKNPGKMMVEGKLMTAKDNPDMYEDETGLPKMEVSSWRSLDAAYKKLHPGKGGTSNGKDETVTDAEAFITLTKSEAVPDTSKLAAAKSALMRLALDPAKSVSSMGNAIKGARELKKTLDATLDKIDRHIADTERKAREEAQERAKQRAVNRAKQQAAAESVTTI